MRLIDWDNVLEWMHRQKETMEQWSMRIAIENYVDEMPTIDAVPVNWIEDYLEQIHKDLDYARQDSDEEAMKRIFWKYETIRWMVADWRHDEKTR